MQFVLAGATAIAPPAVKFVVDVKTGIYRVVVGDDAWYSSPAEAAVVCDRGVQRTLTLSSVAPANGVDSHFGQWTGTRATWSSSSRPISIAYTFQAFSAHPSVGVAKMTFTTPLNTSGCGPNTALSSRFPSFDTSALRATSNHFLSWRGAVMDITKASSGLGALGASGLDCGPVVSKLPGRRAQNALVWSTLDSHKILPQQTTRGSYSIGLAPMTHAAVPGMAPPLSLKASPVAAHPLPLKDLWPSPPTASERPAMLVHPPRL